MAYITADEVKAIRVALRKEYPLYKWSVTKNHHSGVNVSIMAGPVSFSEILDSRNYSQINEYHLDHYGEYEKFLRDVVNIIKTADKQWYDKSDAMTDHFDTAFYIHLSIGRWDRGYEYNGK